MVDVLRVNESGKRLRVALDFDMSNNTSLAMLLTKPSGATLSVTATLGTAQETIDGNVVAANFHMFYDFVPGDVDESGTWQVDVTYTNTTPTPDDIFFNLDVETFEVAD